MTGFAKRQADIVSRCGFFFGDCSANVLNLCILHVIFFPTVFDMQQMCEAEREMGRGAPRCARVQEENEVRATTKPEK